ncbi:MAG: glycerate kinase [Planctomycetota bacterium]|nr:glycerate kinase [Planctomycetota bacterium]
MKIVVAMDSFKGSLRAVEACEAVGRGLQAAIPGVDVALVPLADGGEGTAETLLQARGGSWVPVTVTGPLADRKAEAGYVWLPAAGPGALVEMATASGLPLLEEHERDALRTTTYGTGELLAAAAARGARRLWLAVGGSATVDGGTGAAAALGWRFLDAEGEELPPGGGALDRLARIVPPSEAFAAEVEVLCDVDNPLTGPRGAAAVFGPQKGASPAEVDQLEANLGHFAEVVRRELGKDVDTVPGAGAAGGLAAGAVAFLDARLVSGIDAVMDACGLDEQLSGADWVITGEGRFDGQSVHGKVVSGVSTRAAAAGAQVAVLAGRLELDEAGAAEHGIAALEQATPPDMSWDAARAGAAGLVEAAAARLAARLGPSRTA